jgi:hypothetical protein
MEIFAFGEHREIISIISNKFGCRVGSPPVSFTSLVFLKSLSENIFSAFPTEISFM